MQQQIYSILKICRKFFFTWQVTLFPVSVRFNNWPFFVVEAHHDFGFARSKNPGKNWENWGIAIGPVSGRLRMIEKRTSEEVAELEVVFFSYLFSFIVFFIWKNGGTQKNIQNTFRWKKQQNPGWWFQIFSIFTPIWGNYFWSNLTNIFQMGWNHQLEISFGFPNGLI